MSGSLSSLKNVLEKTDSLVTFLNNVAGETSSRKNNIGKLLYDEELFNKLNTAINRLNELTDLITEQLKSDGLKVKADVDLF